VLDNTGELTGKLNQIDVAATMAKVDATLQNVQQMTEALNSKKGSLGLLMNDPTLYNNLNATMRSADSLLIDLRAHPKRYVHFSVFGKKDK
jgi:phospholipid/cholesterol/gamma-HCH transport system substrate-binding protein